MKVNKESYGFKDLLFIPFLCNPWATSFIALQRVLMGLVPTMQVIVTAKFIDGAIQVYQGSLKLKSIYPSLFALLALLAFNQLANGVMFFATKKLQLSLQAKLRTAITQKRSMLAYEHIENPETGDLINRVASGSEVQISRGFHNLLSLSSNIIEVLGLFLLLFVQAWWAALIIISFSLPLLLLGIKSGQATYEVNREISKVRRKNEYLGEVLLSRETVEERSVFGYSSKINQTWYDLFESARTLELQTRKKWYIRMKSGSLLTTLTSVLISAVLLNPVLAGTISIGMFVSLVNAVFSLVSMMSWQFVGSMDQLAQSGEYLKDLSNFSLLNEVPGAQDLPQKSEMIFESLEFKEVSFSYPGTEKLVLNRLSFQIKAGGHYAFVGVNGAGKTTITKLITGLYPNYSGQILLNGRELQEYAPSELKSFVNVFYQDFARYYVSIGENIALGDPILGYDEQTVAEVTAKLDLTEILAALPQGIETPLGKIKANGQDLSGGEWQKIAMARAVYNPAPLRILDEPTAALDPLAESELYQQFEKISQGKTTIFISHRLGSTKLADQIFVLADGYLQEAGTHSELMEQKGIYHEMYVGQRGWYS